MNTVCDVAIVGAGPYGLSLAAHLKAAGVSFRIFGKKMSTWRDHMPKGMLLKSEGFASNLSAPAKDATLKAYCAEHGIAYADRHRPVPLSVFVDYADWFQARFAPMLQERNIVALEKSPAGFRLTAEDGESFEARRVVLAVGITWFKHLPEALSALPAEAVSHSFDLHDMSRFAGREVVVLGAGASAIDTAVAIRKAGAAVRIVARARAIVFHDAPDANADSLLRALKNPPSGIGPGWRSFLYTKAPLLFHRLPERLRLRIVKRHLGPAPGWFMRPRVEGCIPVLTSSELKSARAKGERIVLDLGDQALEADHVVAATGYRPELGKLPFLGAALRSEIAAVNRAPVLSRNFETSVPGLFACGPLGANSFGPLMRFMVGAEFAAPRLAAHLTRRVRAAKLARAFYDLWRRPAPSRAIAPSASLR